MKLQLSQYYYYVLELVSPAFPLDWSTFLSPLLWPSSVSASPALFKHVVPITSDIRSAGGSKKQRQTRSSHRYVLVGNEEPTDGLSCMDLDQDARLLRDKPKRVDRGLLFVHEEYLVAIDLTSHVGTISTWLATYFLV